MKNYLIILAIISTVALGHTCAQYYNKHFLEVHKLQYLGVICVEGGLVPKDLVGWKGNGTWANTDPYDECGSCVIKPWSSNTQIKVLESNKLKNMGSAGCCLYAYAANGYSVPYKQIRMLCHLLL
jgi:hypothetical protein